MREEHFERMSVRSLVEQIKSRDWSYNLEDGDSHNVRSWKGIQAHHYCCHGEEILQPSIDCAPKRHSVAVFLEVSKFHSMHAVQRMVGKQNGQEKSTRQTSKQSFEAKQSFGQTTTNPTYATDLWLKRWVKHHGLSNEFHFYIEQRQHFVSGYDEWIQNLTKVLQRNGDDGHKALHNDIVDEVDVCLNPLPWTITFWSPNFN